MVDLLFFGAVVALTIGGALFTAAARRRRRRAWRAIAYELGLANVLHPQALAETCVLHATRDGFVVRLVEHDRSKYRPATTTLTVDGCAGALAHVVELRAEAEVTAAERDAVKELELGDRSFDDNVFVRGSRPALVAQLDPETRQRVVEFVASGGRIAAGVATIERKGYLDPLSPSDVTWLSRRLAQTLAVATGLLRPRDLVATLCRRFREEPARRVRLLLLDLLANLLADDARARQTLREGLVSSDLDLRLRAAIALGEEGRDALLDIAGRSAEDDHCAAQAVDALRRRLSLERTIAILDEALPQRHYHTAQAAIAALGRIGGSAAIERLAPVLFDLSASLGLAAAAALAATFDQTAEEPLLAALAHAQPALRVALANALAAVGTGQAVPALRAFLEDGDANPELARAARQAIAEIQARLTGASPGQVSLAEGQAGQISLTEGGASGQVSLSTEDRAAP
jgi:hypothetical protein